ncbi:DUF6349 family protein [Streptomyces tsukubensis]|uniref:Uncharacterized protein n=1 Tax=Streptomyces tsukubensis TaxID=83656 RepID=A0A1V4A266_9ACTN|nr:DUF6349 family protein [Streptomyces tsukubensis]OON73233.1 hypothetical protein B1H18_27330 [Streptomyces tsukubensis]QFR94575.1 hypothetical protein GBW32_17910 [Streptomyces tsukubensis]
MTATVAEPSGARARQTYYWRVRNARTRHRPETAAQAWHIQPGHPGGAYSDLGHELDPPAHHAPTLLSRSRPTGRRGEKQEFRAGCLACGWEGPVYSGGGFGDGDNDAVEDAHDHAFPGWRTLPPINTVEDRWAVPRSRSRWAQFIARYPAGWVEQGAPVVAWRRHHREAHRPPYAERPRYELHVPRPPRAQSRRPADQEALF